MKLKSKINHAMQEGIFFLLLSGALLWYSLDSYNHSFNHDWTQSPSLFPVLVSVLMALFGVIILRQGLREKQADAVAEGTQPLQALILLGLVLAYYLALAVIKLPYLAVTIAGLTFSLSTFEVATIVFLAVMMFYLGVRSKPVLVCVPIGAAVFLSVIFRTMLRVLLP